MSDERRPPFSENAEISVLAAILLEPTAILEARAVVTAEAFYLLTHRRLFRAACALVDANTGVDPVTLLDELNGQDEGDENEDAQYIGFLLDAVPTAANITYHAGIVRRFAAQRRLIEQLEQASQLAWKADQDPAQLAQDLVTRFLPLAAPALGSEGYVAVDGGLLVQLVDEILNRRNTGGIAGVSTGYPEIDHQTGGFRAGELVGICGVPSSGKSIVIANFACNNLRDGIAVGIVAAEMGLNPTVERMLVNESHLNASMVRKGYLDEAMAGKLAKAAARIAKGPGLFIDATPGPDFREVVARAHALKIRHPEIGILYVDYLQLLSDENETRAEELRGISNGLATLALQLKIPIVVGAQLNDKDIEKRSDKRANRSDVQGSSGLLQASSFLVLLHRPSMYEERRLDTLELTFTKARSGPVFRAILEAEMHHMLLRSASNPEPVTTRQEEFRV